MRTTLMTLGGVLLLGSAGILHAQQPPPPVPPTAPVAGAAEGVVDIGFRGTDSTGDTARLERYRDLQSDAFSRILFAKETETYLFHASAVDIGLRDQRYRAQYIGGPVRFTGVFDSLPLNYSYLTSTPWVQASPNVFTLDPAARQQVQAKQVVGVPQNVSDLSTPSIYRGLANPFDLTALRQTGSASLAYDLSPNLGFNATFSSTKKSGQQPSGASFAFNVANELPVALDNRTNDVSAALEWIRTQGMFRIGWNGSWFDKSIHQLVWDNAYRATDTNPIDASGYSNGNGPAQGRMAVAPSNSLNSFSAFGLYKMPAHTTVNGTVAFTRMSQDDPLIPWTINPVINTPAVFQQFPNLAAVPRATAEARVDGVNALINLTTRPNRHFGVTARYRYNDHSNKTPPFDATQYVRFDAVPEATGGVSEQFDIKENAFDLNGTFNLMPVHVAASGIRLRLLRSNGSFIQQHDRQHVPRVGGHRRESTGDSARHLRAHAAEGVRLFGGRDRRRGSQPGLRFYDEADRDRDKGTLMFVVNPVENVEVTFSVGGWQGRLQGPRPRVRAAR